MKWAEQKARGLAQRVLDGELDVLLGSRQLSRLVHDLPPDLEEVCTTFIFVDSETDHLPMGEERQHWAGYALRAKDAESARYATRVEDEVHRACRVLVERLPAPEQTESVER